MQLNILLSNVASFMKRRLIELFGLILIVLCFLFTFTLALYSPENTTLIYKAEGAEVIKYFLLLFKCNSRFFSSKFWINVICNWYLHFILGNKFNYK